MNTAYWCEGPRSDIRFTHLFREVVLSREGTEGERRGKNHEVRKPSICVSLKSAQQEGIAISRSRGRFNLGIRISTRAVLNVSGIVIH